MIDDLGKYSGKKICVAVSGGKDSMALLHYLSCHAEKFNITLSALNCDHGIRKVTSRRDSQFVADYCKKNGIPLLRFFANGFTSEEAARIWRHKCYLEAARENDCIATAHHMNDNAETVLFNLARGTALCGMCGIKDTDLSGVAGKPFYIIKPLLCCSRQEIDEYVNENGVPFVEDETNFSDDYTRNRIRHNVLPELEKSVPGASKAIYRFSRLAAEDEEYLRRQTAQLIYRKPPCGISVKTCNEKVLFRRAVAEIVASFYRKKDYTAEHFERLYALQFSENGKKFEFLGLTAFKEQDCISFASNEELRAKNLEDPLPLLPEKIFYCDLVAVCAEYELANVAEKLQENYSKFLNFRLFDVNFKQENLSKIKMLTFDYGKIPEGAVIRNMRTGDRFTKFGGGTKNLGDYFTDKKIPVRIRGLIPLLCSGNDVLVIFGVEISEKVKIDGLTEKKYYALAPDCLS